MRVGLMVLCLAYVLSQFFRAFLAVLSEVLERDIGTDPEALAQASGLWFLSFAAMQLPVGWALDKIGPRRTASVLLLLGGGGGALLFAFATQSSHVNLAMLFIGVGCSPVLMASYYIFARQFSPGQFATLAALMLGVGSVGNLGASYPMALAAEAFGWRSTLIGLSVVSAMVAVGIAAFVRDPKPVNNVGKGSVIDLLKMPSLWAIFPLMFVNYMPVAGIRGLWIGPYLNDIFDSTTSQVGQASLVMGIAMIVGTLFYGPLDRIFRTQKWVIFIGNALCSLAIFALALFVSEGLVLAIVLCAVIGFFGMTFPIIIAHARGFIPEHLTGRGVTLLNLFGIGGVGLMQIASGRFQGHVEREYGTDMSYMALFGGFGILLLLGDLDLFVQQGFRTRIMFFPQSA